MDSPVLFRNTIIPMKLDTGSDVNIITHKDYKAIKDGPTIKPLQVKIMDYNGQPITILGEVKMTVQYKTAAVKASFLICLDGHTPIMGRELCETMGLIRLVLSLDSEDIFEEYKNITTFFKDSDACQEK